MEANRARELVTSEEATAADLYKIANNFPGLEPWVAAHPACYEGLLEWLEAQPDDRIKAVLQARESGLLGADALRAAGLETQLSEAALPISESTHAIADTGEVTRQTGDGTAETSTPNTSQQADTTALANTDAGNVEATSSAIGMGRNEDATQRIQSYPTPGARAEQTPVRRQSAFGAVGAGNASARSEAAGYPAPSGGYVQGGQQPGYQQQGYPQQGYSQQGYQAGYQQPEQRPVAFQPVSSYGAGEAAVAYDEYEEEEPRRSGLVTALLIILLAIAVVALVVALTIFLMQDDPNPDDAALSGTTSSAPQNDNSPQQPASPQATPSESSSDNPSESADSETIKYPAPAAAIELKEFKAPSGNIVCQLDGEVARCTIIKHQLRSDGAADCANKPFTVEAEPRSVGSTCGQVVPASIAKALPYGSSAKSGAVACTSTRSGMSCWNTKSGTAFKLAIQEWGQSLSGPVK